MRYERLILEAGSTAVTVRFHPRLTVISGLDKLQRDSLVGELLSALSGSRRGTHLEVMTDAARRLAVLRPEKGEDRVLDLGDGEDVTADFRTSDGRLDLLASMGLDREMARRLGRMVSGDLLASSQADEFVAALSATDQSALWAAAERVRSTEARLSYEAELAGVAAEDLPLIEEVEQRHVEFEAAQQRAETARHNAIFTGGATAIGAVPAYLLNEVAALPFLAVSALTTITSIRYRRRKDRAYAAMQEALERAGAESYAGFQLQRIERLMEGQRSRQTLAKLASEQREAVEAWRALAGEATVDWAIANRPRIMAASRELRGRSAIDAGTDDTATRQNDMAHALTARLKQLTSLGSGHEALPLILDEPLEGMDLSGKQWMLETIGRCAGSPQVIFLTADPDVASWARVEAIGGQLAVLEPSPEGASN